MRIIPRLRRLRWRLSELEYKSRRLIPPLAESDQDRKRRFIDRNKLGITPEKLDQIGEVVAHDLATRCGLCDTPGSNCSQRKPCCSKCDHWWAKDQGSSSP